MNLRQLIKKVLNEEVLQVKNRTIHINPYDLSIFPDYERGIIDPEGNLYIIEGTTSHYHEILLLYASNLIPINQLNYKTLKYYLPVERNEGENTFYLSHSYTYDYIQDNINKIKRTLSKCKQKNPTANFMPMRDIDF